ncbi:MAG: hypothetical protein GX287_05825 [Fusobacteria bacterium]|nr:hypothetical protein [Fusobacteriota bacterium]
MKKIIFIFLIMSLNLFSNTESIEIGVNEYLINNLLDVIEEIDGTNNIKILGGKQKLDWKIRNMNIKILPENVLFKGNINVSIFGQMIESPVTGEVNVSLNETGDVIIFKVDKLIPENNSGNFIDLTSIYTPEFEYELPNYVVDNYEFKTPNGSLKKITMDVVKKELFLEKEKIVIKTHIKLNKNK